MKRFVPIACFDLSQRFAQPFASRDAQTAARPTAETLACQAKPGASCRVKAPVGQGLTTHPYRVLRDWEG